MKHPDATARDIPMASYTGGAEAEAVPVAVAEAEVVAECVTEAECVLLIVTELSTVRPSFVRSL